MPCQRKEIEENEKKEKSQREKEDKKEGEAEGREGLEEKEGSRGRIEGQQQVSGAMTLLLLLLPRVKTAEDGIRSGMKTAEDL